MQERGIPPMAWSPLAGGMLFAGGNPNLTATLQAKADDAGVDIGAVAVGWLLAHPAKILPVLGTNNLKRIRHIADALKLNMDRTDWFEIYEAANGIEVP